MQVLLWFFILFHSNINLLLKLFEIILIVNNLPELSLLDQGLILIDLLFKPLLMVVNILMHFSLRIDEHVAGELLDPCHHYLGLNPEIVLLIHYLLAVGCVLLNHLQVLLFDCVEEGLGVVIHGQDRVLFQVGGHVSRVALIRVLAVAHETLTCALLILLFRLLLTGLAHCLLRRSLVVGAREAVDYAFFHLLKVRVVTIKVLSLLRHSYNF